MESMKRVSALAAFADIAERHVAEQAAGEAEPVPDAAKQGNVTNRRIQGGVSKVPKIFNEGKQIDATFEVGVTGDASKFEVLFMSRGGSQGATGARNTEYQDGLLILLGRLKNLRGVLHSVEVDAKSAAVKALSLIHI